MRSIKEQLKLAEELLARIQHSESAHSTEIRLYFSEYERGRVINSMGNRNVRP